MALYEENVKVDQVCDSLRCLQAPDVGSESWWQERKRQGIPHCLRLAPTQCRVTFFWRDPQGDASQTSTRAVYIDVNSVTNHHAFTPAAMVNVAGTDVWYWQVDLPSNWRGSYALIPVDASLLAPEVLETPELHRARHRQWWRAVMERAQADPLNPLTAYAGAWAGQLSALHLPDAADQSAWQTFDQVGAAAVAAQPVQVLDWHSELLANQRPVWIYATGSASTHAEQQARSLVLLLDGQHWALRMPIFSALDKLTQQGQLPAAVYVLIDVIDGQHRQEELACSAPFWQAIQQELLPQVAQFAAHSSEAGRSVIAGQSFGGLAALYAGLHYSQRFGCVLSQSGSFWWPYLDLLDAPPGQACPRKPGSRGWLAEQIQAGSLAQSQLKVYLEVGSREDVMIDLHDSVQASLQQAGHCVNYQQFEGGHDWLCWRGGLLAGLSWLLKP